MKKRSFCVAGGDLRSIYLIRSLVEKGFKVFALGLDEAKLPDEAVHIKTVTELQKCEITVLPLPCSDGEGFLKTAFSKEKTPLSEIIENLPKGSVLMGGLIPKDIVENAKEREIKTFDYYHREEFAVRNAAITAEAAAALSMEMLSESVSGVPVLILGHGRIGRLLSSILKALDAKVTVAARRFSELAWIRSEGMTPLEFRLLDDEISKFRVVFNTVPTMVLNREKLVLVNKDAIVIDLASEPCGTDFEAARELGITAKKALGLPGKFAPKTAGEIVCDTVLNIIDETENEHE